VYESEEVLDTVIAADEEALKVVHPGKQAFHLPTAAIAAQRTSIQGSAAGAPIGRNHLDAVFRFELLVEPVGVTGFVADEAGGQLVEETSGSTSSTS